MIVPVLFNGLKGKADANTLGMIPSTGAPNDVANGTAKLNWYTLPITRTDCMKASVINPNIGGERGVKPCKGLDKTILRRPAISSQGSKYPATGHVRGQRPGLTTDRNYPTNLKIMPLASSFNSAILNKIPNLKG